MTTDHTAKIIAFSGNGAHAAVPRRAHCSGACDCHAPHTDCGEIVSLVRMLDFARMRAREAGLERESKAVAETIEQIAARFCCVRRAQR